MIIIRTDHDDATHYLFEACEPIITYSENKGIKFTDLKEKEVNTSNVIKRINKLKPKFVFFNGHGSPSCFFDNKMNSLISLEHSKIFSGTITYARVCDCLTQLGGAAVKEGCKSFIGYSRPFWISKLDGYISRPLKDPVAKPIIDSSNKIALSLLKGKTVQEAIYDSQKVTTDYILDLIYSKDPYRQASLAALVRNSQSLDYKGNSQERL